MTFTLKIQKLVKNQRLTYSVWYFHMALRLCPRKCLACTGILVKLWTSLTSKWYIRSIPFGTRKTLVSLDSWKQLWVIGSKFSHTYHPLKVFMSSKRTTSLWQLLLYKSISSVNKFYLKIYDWKVVDKNSVKITILNSVTDTYKQTPVRCFPQSSISGLWKTPTLHFREALKYYPPVCKLKLPLGLEKLL